MIEADRAANVNPVDGKGDSISEDLCGGQEVFRVWRDVGNITIGWWLMKNLSVVDHTSKVGPLIPIPLLWFVNS